MPVGLIDGLLREQPEPPLLVGWIALLRLVTRPPSDLRPLIVLSGAIPFGLLAGGVWSIARRHAGVSASRLALLALAASPLSLSYAAQVLMETLLALTVLGVLYTAARAMANPRPTTAAALGSAIGLAMLAKLTFSMLLPLYAPGRFARDPRVRDRRVIATFVVPLLIAGSWYGGGTGPRPCGSRSSPLDTTRWRKVATRARRPGHGWKPLRWRWLVGRRSRRGCWR